LWYRTLPTETSTYFSFRSANMSGPGEGYPQGQYTQEYGQPQSPYADQEAFGDEASAPAQPVTQEVGKKKKRAYAAGAFDVGSGANATAGGQIPATGDYGLPHPQQLQRPGDKGFQEAQGPYGSQGYGAQHPGAPAPGGVGGYQAPEPYYTGGGPTAAVVGGVTAGMASMQLGPGQSQAQAPPQARAGPLNQLYPTDLMSQPFNVSELDLPPPPIVLPPNVSHHST
jgi:protein transport protein SEC24